ncbi:hypothetical protein DACRYDRAFT_21923 [Dacryopinax primogenitus]|uniref:Uncharacterized protein n=1 Tax=Dacryopinax primogenitus (strain DJM 731) TaxID=1858805 RepID=M5G1T9_DACPD|nr:uncharacterized protein DACRYDRAFT_21923 [Dacryopinax primogenitus]EJU02180.1 hypothetical protein DACRYDRAFT_21923 [Dacryopinax primogenitus]
MLLRRGVLLRRYLASQSNGTTTPTKPVRRIKTPMFREPLPLNSELTLENVLDGKPWPLKPCDKTSGAEGLATRLPSKHEREIDMSRQLRTVFDATPIMQNYRESTQSVLSVAQKLIEEAGDSLSTVVPINRIPAPLIHHPSWIRGSSETATSAWVDAYLLSPVELIYSALTKTIPVSTPEAYYNGSEPDIVRLTERADGTLIPLHIIEVKKRSVLANIVTLMRKWFASPDNLIKFSHISQSLGANEFHWPLFHFVDTKQWGCSNAKTRELNQAHYALVQIWSTFWDRGLSEGAFVSDENFVICIQGEDANELFVGVLSDTALNQQRAFLCLELFQLYRARNGRCAYEWTHLDPSIRVAIEDNFSQYESVFGRAPPHDAPPTSGFNQGRECVAECPTPPEKDMHRLHSVHEPSSTDPAVVIVDGHDGSDTPEYTPLYVDEIAVDMVGQEAVLDLKLMSKAGNGILGTVYHAELGDRKVMAKVVDIENLSSLEHELDVYLAIRSLWNETVPEVYGLHEALPKLHWYFLMLEKRSKIYVTPG